MKRVKVVWKFKRELGIRPMQYTVSYRDTLEMFNGFQIVRVTIAE